jgi:hypothetical protein
MGAVDILKLAGEFGPTGLVVAFMIWDRIQQRKFDRERIAADLEAARAMTTLAVKIDGMKH